LQTENQLSKYLTQLKKLRRSRNKKIGAAPHKPILLLAIIEGIEKGDIISNRIAITPELVLYFKDIWSKLVTTAHSPNFALPFFHMKSEPFWRLISLDGAVIPVTASGSIKSLSGLKDALAFAEIDKALMFFLFDPVSREVIKMELLEFYFPETKNMLNVSEKSFIAQLEEQVLNDDRITYTERVEELRSKMQVNDFEEEVYIRSGIFKREIPKIYNYTCAISGLRVEATINAQLVDACHIVPFAVSKDDTIGNGFSLTPTLHRAFDRGLITINDDYIVRISPDITEVESAYSLKQFEGKQIKLPVKTQHYPLQENFKWHRLERYIL
jgi:putative restriction endonuclease